MKNEVLETHQAIHDALSKLDSLMEQARDLMLDLGHEKQELCGITGHQWFTAEPGRTYCERCLKIDNETSF